MSAVPSTRVPEKCGPVFRERAHDGGPPRFRLCKFARKDRKVDGEDADDGHEHHVRAVDGHEGLEEEARCDARRLVGFRRGGAVGDGAEGRRGTRDCAGVEEEDEGCEAEVEVDWVGREDGEGEEEGHHEDEEFRDRDAKGSRVGS